MKKLLLAILTAFCLSQPGNTQAIDTSTIVYSWKLDESFANRIRVPVDTILDNFQAFSPLNLNYTASQSLGSYGLPAQTIVFNERNFEQEYLLINSFMPFMRFYPENHYYNTRKPYSYIIYRKSGASQTKAETLEAFHSQNLTKTLNVGAHYVTSSSLGHYAFQKAKNNSFTFFSSLSSKYYSYHLNVNFNKAVTDENGGILGDTLITDTTYVFSKDIPTLFRGTENSIQHRPDVLNEIKNLNILAVQELSFRSKPTPRDSSFVRKTRIFYPKLVYLFTLNRSSRMFTDRKPLVGYTAGMYRNIYVNDSVTLDSMVTWKLGNAIRLQFQGKKNNHYFIDYSYELLKYSLGVRGDLEYSGNDILFIDQPFSLPGLNYSTNHYNSFVSTGFSKLFAGRFDVNLYGKFYLTGYRSRDFLLSGDIKLIFGNINKPVTFYAKGVSELKSPDYLYTRYISNNFLWTRNFNRTTIQHLSTNLAISSNKFAIQADYYLFSNFIFMDEDAQPAQYGNALSIFVLGVSKQFDFWKVTSLNKVVYQMSENKNVVDLPKFVLYNSTYLKHLFNFRATGGKLLTMLGFDLYYNTKYYADAYMPSLNSFHRQKEKLLGNYPYMDAFLNVQLKRFKFFVKVEHLNQGWFENLFNSNYFTTLHYPRNGRDLKFGLSWTFYD